MKSNLATWQRAAWALKYKMDQLHDQGHDDELLCRISKTKLGRVRIFDVMSQSLTCAREDLTSWRLVEVKGSVFQVRRSSQVARPKNSCYFGHKPQVTPVRSTQQFLDLGKLRYFVLSSDLPSLHIKSREINTSHIVALNVYLFLH